MANLTYEMIFMLDPESGDEQRDKIATDVKAKLEAGGDVLHEANWGLRKMAYEIDKRESADYRFFKFSAGKDLLDDFDHSLKITDGVLRFRIFKSDPEAPTMVPPDTEQIRCAATTTTASGATLATAVGDRAGAMTTPPPSAAPPRPPRRLPATSPSSRPSRFPRWFRLHRGGRGLHFCHVRGCLDSERTQAI